MAIFNMNKMKLEDVEFFTDIRLDGTNIYSVTIVCLDTRFEEIVCQFTQQIKKYSYIQMIQQMGKDFCRFTIVSHITTGEFSKILQREIEKTNKIYKCNINVLE